MNAESMVLYLSSAAVVALMGYICCVDLKRYIILDKSLCLLTVAVFIQSMAGGADVWNLVCGMAFAFGVFACVFYLGQGVMGAGDVKLAAVLGLWLGWPQAGMAVYLSFILGGVIAAVCLAAGFKRRRDKIAFAPVMAAAFGAVYFWGDEFYIAWQSIVCGT